MMALCGGEHGVIPDPCSLGATACPEEGLIFEAQKDTPAEREEKEATAWGYVSPQVSTTLRCTLSFSGKA